MEKMATPAPLRTENSLVTSPEDEEVMIIHLLNTPDLDLNAPQ